MSTLPRCTACQTPVSRTPDWTLWPWPDGQQLCSSCNEERHRREDYCDVEAREARRRAGEEE